MENLHLLPEMLQDITLSLESYLDKIFNNREKTLPVKIKETPNNVIVTWNIFPDSSDTIEGVFKDIKNLINQEMNKGYDGEVLKYNISNGQIFDSGVEAFLILEGFSWDLYLYKPETFIYIRLLHESRLDKEKDQWISVDIDIINNSAWFRD